MASQPFRGIAYERLTYEDVDIAFDNSLNNDFILRSPGDDKFPDREYAERRLLRKIDLRMSILVLMWILNFIGRHSISSSILANNSAARLHGFEEDLHLEGQQFNTILSVFYVGYTLMQVPSNMYLNRVGRPSVYLPTCMVTWGLVLVLMGTTKGFIGAVCTNFLLGAVEAAFFPGALLTLSKWYKRREIGQRTAILICGGMISHAFGPLVASVIMDGMDGVMGQAAWRWLYYIEGFMTVFVAICATFILPDFSAIHSSWLTVEEQALAQFRMEEDFGGRDDEAAVFKQGTSGLRQALTDWKVWWLALVMTSMKVSLSFGVFFPTLSATLGYSSTVSLLLCVPPWIVATCGTFLMSRHSDKAGERFGHIAAALLVGITGFLMAMATMNTAVRYFSLFLIAHTGAASMICFAWVSNSISHPASKRAVALAFVNSFSSLGSIAGSYVWQKSWGPSYWNSFVITIAAGTLCIIMSWIFRRHLAKLNQEIEIRMGASQSKGFTYLL